MRLVMKKTPRRYTPRGRKVKREATGGERYLVTGGNGQLGSALRREVPYELVSYVKTREALDITRHRRSAASIAALNPQAVINCAAYTNVRMAEKEWRKAWAVNAEAVGRLAESLAERNIPLIHVSTDFVFGMDDSRREPYQEHDFVGPTNYYGHSKLGGEQLIRQVADRFPDWWYVIVRTAGVFEVPWRQPKNFVGYMAEKMRLQQEILAVRDVWTNVMCAEELAKCLLYFAKCRTQIPRGVYHVVNRGEATWYDVVAELAACLLFGRRYITPVTSEEFERRRGCDPQKVAKYTCLSTEKYARLPGAPQLRTWQAAIKWWTKKWKGT